MPSRLARIPKFIRIMTNPELTAYVDALKAGKSDRVARALARAAVAS